MSTHGQFGSATAAHHESYTYYYSHERGDVDRFHENCKCAGAPILGLDPLLKIYPGMTHFAAPFTWGKCSSCARRMVHVGHHCCCDLLHSNILHRQYFRRLFGAVCIMAHFEHALTSHSKSRRASAGLYRTGAAVYRTRTCPLLSSKHCRTKKQFALPLQCSHSRVLSQWGPPVAIWSTQGVGGWQRLHKV